MLVDTTSFPGNSFANFFADGDVESCGRHEVNPSRIDFDDLASLAVQPRSSFLQIPPDCDARGGIEIGEMPLRKAQIPIEAVDQNLERVLQRLEVMLLLRIFRGSHLRLRLEPERAQVGEQMAEDLQLVGSREAIELEHDRRIKERVAMQKLRHAGKKISV